jgi:hypothetical protein
MRSWSLWPVSSRGSTTTIRTGGVAGQRMDASTVATSTTSSPIAPRMGKLEGGPRDHHSGLHKGKWEYTSGKHKSKRGFYKEALKNNYL